MVVDFDEKLIKLMRGILDLSRVTLQEQKFRKRNNEKKIKFLRTLTDGICSKNIIFHSFQQNYHSKQKINQDYFSSEKKIKIDSELILENKQNNYY